MQPPSAVRGTPEIHALGKELVLWWRETASRRGSHRFRAEANRGLALRAEAALASGRSLDIDVTPRSVHVRGILFPDADAERPLGAHLHGLGIATLVLAPAADCGAFVRFLERLASEPSGEGFGEGLRRCIPEGLQVQVREPGALPAGSRPAREEHEPRAAALPASPEPLHPERLELLTECLAKLRHGALESVESHAVAVAQILLAVAQEGNEADREGLVERVAEAAAELLKAGSYRHWGTAFRVLDQVVTESRSLSGLRLHLRLLAELGEDRFVGLAFRHFQESRPCATEWLASYLEALPATSLARVARAALQCQTLCLEPGTGMRSILDRFLRRSGSHSPEGLRELAADSQPRVARLVVELLPELPPGAAAQAIEAALHNPAASVRYDAVRRAQCLPLRQRLECLPRALVDPAASVRRLAAQSLGECCVPRAMRPLMEAVAAPVFRRRDPSEQVAFFRALAVSCRPEALYTVEHRIIPPPRSLLRQLLDRVSRTPEDPVRDEVIRALARLGSSQALDILKRGARCSDAAVARRCRAALREARSAAIS